jgi:hypothetical protein
LPRIEGTHDQRQPARVQYRIGIAIESADMEQRQDTEKNSFLRNERRNSEVDGVDEGHAMRNYDAFRLSGRARRVDDGRDIIETSSRLTGACLASRADEAIAIS